MRARQLSLSTALVSAKAVDVDGFAAASKFFGGAHLKNSHAKTARAIACKKPMHLVMRSSLAKGARSFLRRDRELRVLFEKQAKLFGVRIYRFANAGNHLHLIVLPRSRGAFKNFLRAVSGLTARLVLGAERGSPQTQSFWDQRPFTRILEWGRDFLGVKKYLLQNALEAIGFVPYKTRKSRIPLLARSRVSTAPPA
jgi:REP element-mobilizing transposase RayT